MERINERTQKRRRIDAIKSQNSRWRLCESEDGRRQRISFSRCQEKMFRECSDRRFTSSNPGPIEEIRTLNFSPDGNGLAVVTQGGDLILFSAATPDEAVRRPEAAPALPNAAQ